jgi:hypothetical protein
MRSVCKQVLDKFDHAIELNKFKQNVDKGQSWLRLFGDGSRTTLRQLIAQPCINAQIHARYLGPQLHWQGRSACEVSVRIRSAWNSWYMYKSFWSSDAPFCFRQTVFKVVVISVLFSGLAPFVLTKSDYKKLGAAYYNMLRKLAQGAACIKSYSMTCPPLSKANLKHKALTNAQVCRLTSQISVTSELRIIKLKFLQNMLRPHGKT